MELNSTNLALEFFTRSPLWAILPDALATMLSRGTQDVAPTKPRTADKIAVIPIQGILTNYGPARYGTTYRSIADAAVEALYA